MLKVVNVVGARPNFMKMAPICDAMRASQAIEQSLVHTGQHYDHAMSDLFFNQLGLPEPDVYLGVGSAGHGTQTGTIMIEFERTLLELEPDLVTVVGDVNSTIACGLVAVKLGVRLAHVEAGLRSFDRSMPEEINRVLTDQISDFLFTTERLAANNLRHEGIGPEKIHFVGNVMIDSLLKHRPAAAQRRMMIKLGLAGKDYVLVTLHRPSNVDEPAQLSRLVQMLLRLTEASMVVFPVHPRTRSRLHEIGALSGLEGCARMHLVEPLGYLDFLQCMDNARVVVTDSGGVQEETTVLGVPCVTARDNTERPITVSEGTNVLAGRDVENIYRLTVEGLKDGAHKGRRPELWDGAAAERIVNVLLEGQAR